MHWNGTRDERGPSLLFFCFLFLNWASGKFKLLPAGEPTTLLEPYGYIQTEITVTWSHPGYNFLMFACQQESREGVWIQHQKHIFPLIENCFCSIETVQILPFSIMDMLCWKNKLWINKCVFRTCQPVLVSVNTTCCWYFAQDSTATISNPESTFIVLSMTSWRKKGIYEPRTKTAH